LSRTRDVREEYTPTKGTSRRKVWRFLGQDTEAIFGAECSYERFMGLKTRLQVRDEATRVAASNPPLYVRVSSALKLDSDLSDHIPACLSLRHGTARFHICRPAVMS